MLQSVTMETIINTSELEKARAMALGDAEKEIRIQGRRAKDPAEQVAYAEVLQELMDIRQRWVEAGLVAGELMADAAA